MTAVSDGDWSRLRSVTDLVPGTFLIEDPDEPVLVFPVQADSPGKAFLFVDGILKLVDLEPVSGNITPTPAVDVETDEDDGDDPQTSAERAVNEWIEQVPTFGGHVTEDGTVEFV
ncbi:hypothetical protein ACFPK1_18895 [Actinomycetospora rhizophila]|uniref:Uncharacterized protein n=2 Tax=Actinomycetospora rhizophila TaxID=1416876 RepID=A0ABV9ZHV2_9PSEU